MKTNSIKFKIGVFLFITISFATGFILHFINTSYKNNIKLASEQAVLQAKKSFDNLIKNDSRMMHATLTGLLSNSEIKAAFKERNRDKLYDYTKSVFDKLKNETGITHWYFIESEPEKTCFLRVHNKGKNSDIITRFTYEESIKTKKMSYGIELGKTAFALRVVHPYYDAGKIIGYMELGEEIEHFFEIMKKQTGDDYGLLIKKEFLDKEKWASVCESKKSKNNWDKMPNTLLVENTSNDDEIIKFDGQIKDINENGIVLNEIKKGDKILVHGIITLHDAAGKKAGGIFVFHDVTHFYTEMFVMKRKVIFSVIAVMGFGIFITLFMLNKLVFVRLEKLVGIATRVVGGDYEAAVKSNSDDEIGKFETLFEQFRQVFVNLLEKYKKTL